MTKIAIQILDVFFNVVAGIFLLRLILNEINPNPFSPVIKILHRITDPILVPIRKILPDSLKDKLYIDISPLIAFLLIIALKFVIINALSVLLVRHKVRPLGLELE